MLENVKDEKNLEQFTAEFDSLLKAVRKSHGETGCNGSAVSDTLDDTMLLRRYALVVPHASQT